MNKLLQDIDKAKEEYEARNNKKLTILFNGCSEEFIVSLKTKKS